MDRLLGNIIVIALTLLALVGLTYAGYNGSQNHKAGVVVNNVVRMVTDARAGFSQSNNGYASFTTANVPAVVNGDMFPTDMMRGSAVVDLWDDLAVLVSTNSILQGVAGSDGGDGETVSQCVKVATGMKGYASLGINGQIFTRANLPDQVTAGAAYSAMAMFSVTFQ